MSLNYYYDVEERISTLNAKTKKFDTVETRSTKNHLNKRLEQERLRVILATNSGMEIA